MKKLLVMCFAVLTFTACESDLANLNKDIKSPEEVPAGTLFANSQVELFNFMTSTNVNVNNFRLWAQQWAQTTYADESNYILTERNVNGAAWTRLYSRIIKDANEASLYIAVDEFLSASEKANQQAMVEVMTIFSYHILVDIFGDVPYSAALGEDVTPAYDDDATIYADLATRLDAAINTLSGDSGMGSSDLVYEGDADAWRKFANSLKLRLAIRMADVNTTLAQNMAEQAIGDGVFTSSADDFELVYQSATPHTNPLWVDLVQSGRSDYVAAGTLLDMMNSLNDPRVSSYYQTTLVDSVTNGPLYVGGAAGDNNSYGNLSHPGTYTANPEFPGTIMSYTEVEFLLADAAARWGIGGSAEDHYNAAITSSIIEWGGSAADAADYLAQADVAYTTATGEWKEVIANQKWIAMYDQGFEAWSTYRLYDSPDLPPAVQAGITPPTRYTYPVTEFSLNGENVQAAASAIGGDDLKTPVFWDVN